MVSQIMAFIFHGGELLDLYETLGAVSSKTWTCPAGKRWLILGAYIERDANATLTLELFNVSDKRLGYPAEQTLIGAGVTNIYFWRKALLVANYIYPISEMMLLKEGDYIKATWGAGQTTPEVALIYIEV